MVCNYAKNTNFKANSQNIKWQSGTPMPTPRYDFGAAAVGGKLLIAGGSNYPVHPGNNILASAEVFDGSLPEKMERRHVHDQAAV